MQPYRIYPLTSTGKLMPPIVHDCTSDDDAIEFAKSLPAASAEHGFEIWQLGRPVARVGVIDRGERRGPLDPGDLAADPIKPR